MPLENLLPLVGFAIGFSGFVLNLLPNRRPKSRSTLLLVLTFFVAFLVIGAATYWQHWRQDHYVQEISVEVIRTIGHEAKSIDQIQEALPHDEFVTISEALTALVRVGRVGSRMADIRDDAGLRYRVRLYFAIE